MPAPARRAIYAITRDDDGLSPPRAVRDRTRRRRPGARSRSPTPPTEPSSGNAGHRRLRRARPSARCRGRRESVYDADGRARRIRARGAARRERSPAARDRPRSTTYDGQGRLVRGRGRRRRDRRGIHATTTMAIAPRRPRPPRCPGGDLRRRDRAADRRRPAGAQLRRGRVPESNAAATNTPTAPSGELLGRAERGPSPTPTTRAAAWSSAPHGSGETTLPLRQPRQRARGDGTARRGRCADDVLLRRASGTCTRSNVAARATGSAPIRSARRASCRRRRRHVVKQVDRDSYGRVLSDSGPASSSRSASPAAIEDPDTGLVRFGAARLRPGDRPLHRARSVALTWAARSNLFAYAENRRRPGATRAG